MKQLLLCVLMIGATSWLTAQQLNDQPVISQENIQKITEVYGSAFVEQNPNLVVFFDRLLNERISYQQLTQTSDEKYPLISSFGFNNKLNPNLIPLQPESFDPETFNPLIYGVGYTNKQILILRIDGTNYIMIVQPE